MPLAGVVVTAVSGPGADIPARDLARYAGTSAALALLVALGTGIVGTASAWLLAFYRFPGRRVFTWALALPFAMPAFAMAYAYTDLFDPAGAVRMAVRESAGIDLAVPMRSLGGAAFVLTCAFYPYVYLAMRAAFASQSAAAFEAARMLGCTPLAAFRRAVLPLARPALAAGLALAIMETLADYGAVQFMAVQTLTTGVVRSWAVFGSVAGAAQLALLLVAAAAVLLLAERHWRRGAAFDGAKVAARPLLPRQLKGAKAVAAALACGLLLTAALVLPVAWLFSRALAQRPDVQRLVDAAWNSVLVAGAGAAVTTVLALALALGAARAPGAMRMAGLGYATPGAALAIGLLLPAGVVWTLAPAAGSFWIGIVLLLYAYAARLMAAAAEPIGAALSRVTPGVAEAARSLGRTEVGAALTVQVPLARAGLVTALLLVFVDVLKELPATLILRPFGFDTLAVMASNYALDERLGQAGWPSLLIVLAALGPTVWLSRQVTASGDAAERRP